MKQSSFWQKTKAVHFNNADLKSETKQKKTFLAHLYAAVKKSFYNAAASFTFRTLAAVQKNITFFKYLFKQII